MALLNQTQQAYYDGGEYGNYQFTSLEDIIDNFMATYVGEDKILQKTNRSDVSFHAHRAMQELSFDTFKSCKSQEITVPSTLQMILPQDYVNYTKVSWVDTAGIKHILYPASKTSNPTNPLQNSDGDFALQAVGTLTDNTDTIVLDDEYANILVGMIVSGPNIPVGSTVDATSNSGGITTLTISANVTFTGTETLTFTPSDGSLILQEQSTFILENVTWASGEDKITQSPNTDVSNIEVGMLVSHEDFSPGTTVIDVNGAVITTSNPASAASSSPDEVTFISTPGDSDTWSNYKSATPAENNKYYNYEDDIYWPANEKRYGIEPQYAQANGSFYIDCVSGKIHFSSNISGKTVVLDYISDSLGTPGEMQVHKFAEEAMYKWIIYGCVSARMDIPEHIVMRYKKERFAETRKAKLRLSNFKLEELTQILRGKSKWIKH